MSDDREREHCERVAFAFWQGNQCTCDPDIPFCDNSCTEKALADLIQRERAAAAAEARDKALEEAASWHDRQAYYLATIGAAQKEEAVMFRLSEKARVHQESAASIRALRGGGR